MPPKADAPSAAHRNDGQLGIVLLKQLPKVLTVRLKRLGADGSYRGAFVDWMRKKFKKIAVDITLRKDGQKGFEVIPFRWVVERCGEWESPGRRKPSGRLSATKPRHFSAGHCTTQDRKRGGG